MDTTIYPKPIMPKPFVKVTGGKSKLAPEILKHISEDLFSELRTGRATYYEPFVGGGALFFRLRPGVAKLNDSNPRLINVYKWVSRSVESLIQELRTERKRTPYVYDMDTYYEIRKFFNEGTPAWIVEPVARRQRDTNTARKLIEAAQYIYLNKTCFNGLYRVNSSGQFNVPFGRYTNPTICDAENLRACARILFNTTITCADFVAASKNAGKGDLVYMDCPYAPISATSNFTSFTVDGFTDKDQVRLRDLALMLKKRGVNVILSNSAAPLIYKLYEKGFKIHEIDAVRSINCDGEGRGKIKELIIT